MKRKIDILKGFDENYIKHAGVVHCWTQFTTGTSGLTLELIAPELL